MHKFELSIYKQIWEDKDVVTSILNNPDLIRANHDSWRRNFIVDPMITPTNAEGEAVFTSRMRKIESGVLMDMRAPLGDSIPEDVKGMEAYQGTIQEFISKGSVETAEMREYKKQHFEQIGDAELVRRFAQEVLQPRIDSANQTLSYMGNMLMTTGKIIYRQGMGMKGSILKADIPAENFLTAGEKVWTDPTCKILDQMVKIEEEIKDSLGININWQWKITRKMFVDCFLNNEQVKEWVRYLGVVNNTPLPDGLTLTEEMVTRAIPQHPYGLSKIVIEEDKQKDAVNGIVNGWKEGVAVFCPAGPVGLIRHTTIADLRLLSPEYTNPANTYTFASALDGCAFVRNSVIVNGNLKEWHSDLVLAATPTLDEFLYHYIIDTKTADNA
jgi:hypothetical protein